MKYSLIFTILLLIFSCGAKKSTTNIVEKIDATYQISGTAVYNTTYCGGAYPSEEVLAYNQMLRIVKNTTIKFVLSSDSTIVITTKTNSLGEYKINLSQGIWHYYLTNDFERNNCEKLFDIVFGEIIVETENQSDYQLLFHLPCDPCDPYSNIRP